MSTICRSPFIQVRYEISLKMSPKGGWVAEGKKNLVSIDIECPKNVIYYEAANYPFPCALFSL